MIYDVNLICYKPDDSENWKIYIPKTLQENSVKWFHHVLNHPGILRQLKTMSTHFYIPKLKTVIENQIKTCDACQCFKLPGGFLLAMIHQNCGKKSQLILSDLEKSRFMDRCYNFMH